MCKKIRLLLLLLLGVSWANASKAQDLTLVTSKSRPSCEAKNPCLITEPKSKQNFRVVFSLKEHKGSGSAIESVTIENLKTRKKETFSTPKCEAVLPGEFFKLFSGDLNGDGYLDLALHAFMAATGPMQYQFIFDPKTHHFKMLGPVPEPDTESSGD